MQRKMASVLAVSSALWFAACSTIDSSSVDTDGISAQFRVEADPVTLVASITGQLRAGDATSLTTLNMNATDSLVALRGTEQKPMQGNRLFHFIEYRAQFSDTQATDRFTVNFTRNPDAQHASVAKRNAPNSTVAMPTKFVVTAHPTGSISRANDMTIAWSTAAGSADESMLVSVTSSCTKAISSRPGAMATHVVLRLEAARPEQANASCEATVTIERKRSGTLDPNYGKGGDITAAWVQTVTFTSAP